ncbi:GNAT family N-acetyltransferase [Pseudonocardia sp. KRD291]|uniref:GNAT family N-acetyltransferase n=1 Tax=Pseudonocardia sp. KRD291 TaxID=2792007 RepID=UPI001C49EDFF|nr:GNAT family N-acetyltransferase [Pseudonocardia sp. KRD291]MBW0101282.1 acetyltransferase [Pseudonocardia sp. KRD291]
MTVVRNGTPFGHRPPLPRSTGSWTFRTARPVAPDLDLVHRWMNDPDVARFWDQAWSRADWREELSAQLEHGPAHPCIVERGGRPFAYLELYWSSRHAIARHYPAREGDVGVHIALGDPGSRGGGRGTELLRDTAHGMYEVTPGCTRVLAEPAADNGAARAAFGRAGFHELGEIELAHKRAALVVHTAGTDDVPALRREVTAHASR